MNVCGILFPRRNGVIKDEEGCYLPTHHIGPHEFKSKHKIIVWETDYDCDCKDCQSFDSDNWCIIYSEK